MGVSGYNRRGDLLVYMPFYFTASGGALNNLAPALLKSFANLSYVRFATTYVGTTTGSTVLDNIAYSIQTLDALPITISLPTSLPTTLPTSISLPTSLPTSLPVTLPTSLPTSLPTTLPVTLPTSIPTTLPVTLPTSLPTVSVPFGL